MKCEKAARAVCDGACTANRPNQLVRFTLQSSTLVALMFLMLGVFVALTLNAGGMRDTMGNVGWLMRAWRAVTERNFLSLLVVGTPFLGALAQIRFGRYSCHRRDMYVIVTALVTVFLVMLLYPGALAGGYRLEFPGLLGIGLSFNVDMLSFVMLLITAVLWFLVMVYAHEYMKKERHCNRFFLFMAITYGAVLGAIVSGDLLTMFLFFEVMTFSSYMLVTHGQDEESYNAGYNFIFMGLLGGFAIFAALVMMQVTVGDLRFESAISALQGSGPMQYVILGLLVFGFGVKAGMAPVHVWLPRAHPVAPTPASALLSGILIKVGAYGILRVATSYYFPASATVMGAADPLWSVSEQAGVALIWLGIVTMSVGVFFALQQSNIKRMLAYHSVSQMGYIVMGIGVALYLGYVGAMGYAGALYHIINHALFKSLLFMVAGVVYFHTREADMYKLGGLWRKLPLTATVCLMAAFAISGVPLFNGYVSKTILHHGIVEAYTYKHASFRYAEMLFLVVSAGTACSFIKMFYYVFLGKMPEQYRSIKPEYNCLDTALVAVAVLILGIGLFPGYVLNTLIVPVLHATTYDPVFIDRYISGMNVFTFSDLWIMVPILAGGFFIFFMGKKFHLFHLRIPAWFRLEHVIFFPANVTLRLACKAMHGKQCPLTEEERRRLELKDNARTGFLERFIVATAFFNRRYEATIIKSDAFIYTSAITVILLMMALLGFL